MIIFLGLFYISFWLGSSAVFGFFSYFFITLLAQKFDRRVGRFVYNRFRKLGCSHARAAGLAQLLVRSIHIFIFSFIIPLLIMMASFPYVMIMYGTGLMINVIIMLGNDYNSNKTDFCGFLSLLVFNVGLFLLACSIVFN